MRSLADDRNCSDDLMLVLPGRPVAPDELTGPSAAQLLHGRERRTRESPAAGLRISRLELCPANVIAAAEPVARGGAYSAPGV
jgi:hypothetical protein